MLFPMLVMRFVDQCNQHTNVTATLQFAIRLDIFDLSKCPNIGGSTISAAAATGNGEINALLFEINASKKEAFGNSAK